MIDVSFEVQILWNLIQHVVTSNTMLNTLHRGNLHEKCSPSSMCRLCIRIVTMSTDTLRSQHYCPPSHLGSSPLKQAVFSPRHSRRRPDVFYMRPRWGGCASTPSPPLPLGHQRLSRTAREACGTPLHRGPPSPALLQACPRRASGLPSTSAARRGSPTSSAPSKRSRKPPRMSAGRTAGALTGTRRSGQPCRVSGGCRKPPRRGTLGHPWHRGSCAHLERHRCAFDLWNTGTHSRTETRTTARLQW
mmetsp:Transcript_3905/g.9530  ORF Transcript_3905/g.9530 Transcript_3905/m.9530 type:complete len:247 (+) Transcript_3905:3-743(+)